MAFNAYLREHVGDAVASALAQIVLQKPDDPVEFLGNYLLQYDDLNTAASQSALWPAGTSYGAHASLVKVNRTIPDGPRTPPAITSFPLAAALHVARAGLLSNPTVATKKHRKGWDGTDRNVVIL
ncbi:hypothetical protein SeMB42_g05906 [Synchytrium endobioticum]|uniref:RIIa domain-containing protein n=1 Tax=Synchytrium endobioticum TaxID=286115 RepID=A0A507CNG0_9FUNG|nr:hypothetical protein SeMB42_g05906 [Synchytrium endobioticum]TPX45311.1 hypothetical protein SeLEV6574_g03944 [Synchytrium endobioticum]